MIRNRNGVALFLVLFLISPLAAAEKSSLVLINGGVLPEENFDEFRFDLKAFNHFLGQNKDVDILDAGGPGTSYVIMLPDGDTLDWKEIERSPLGGIVLGKEPLGLPSKKATKSNLIETYKKNGKNSLPTTYLYHDHGGEGGPFLWGMDQVTPEEHLKLQKENFPPGKLYRSVHVHCVSDRGFLDPDRKKTENWPKNWDGWKKQLDNYYRKNSCHLALGTDESTSAPIGDHFSVEKSGWKDLLSNTPALSLSQLAERLRKSRHVTTTVSLSSDLLIEDVFEFICSMSQEGEAPKGSHGTQGRVASGSVCNSKLKAKVDAAKQAAKEVDELIGERDKINSMIVTRTLEKKYPTEFDAWMKSLESRDQLIAKMHLSKNALTSAELRKIEDELEADNKKWEKMRFEQTALIKGRKLEPIFDAEFEKWEKSKNKEADAPLMTEFLKKTPPEKNENVEELLYKAGAKASVEKKNATFEFRKVQKKFVEDELKRLKDEPGVKTIQEYYDAMLRCEDSKLN